MVVTKNEQKKMQQNQNFRNLRSWLSLVRHKHGCLLHGWIYSCGAISAIRISVWLLILIIIWVTKDVWLRLSWLLNTEE